MVDMKNFLESCDGFFLRSSEINSGMFVKRYKINFAGEVLQKSGKHFSMAWCIVDILDENILYCYAFS